METPSDFRPTLEGADALMLALETLSGKEARAAWLLWRNRKYRWAHGDFYDRDENRRHGRRWLRGAVQRQMGLSERQAQRIVASLVEKGLIVERDGYALFIPPNRTPPEQADTNRRESRHKPSENTTQSVGTMRHKTSEEPTQTVGKADTNCRESRRKPSTYTNRSKQPTDPNNEHPSWPDTREESLEERERRYAEAQRRQAEEHRRREGERFGLPAGFLEKYYVKGDGR